MVRIQAKGGNWKNSEDEILKAMVMKYGHNQWARISSLLNRKTAAQCKARWYEWLDPSIKKTEWSRDEDEKLLHLAKIMPTQWRTIAPIIGRTATQCLERYEYLLDAAQGPDKDYDPADDSRRLRPGEIDPNPESKPARPDQIDMDEDEKEMLNEARARLANTRGKKAKRIAREKQLEEARRIAAQQKSRELKAAGIQLSSGRKLAKLRKQRQLWMDMNDEIPMYRRVQGGFYDTSEERELGEKQRNPKKFIGKTIEELSEQNREKQEEIERKKDARLMKLHRKTNLPEVLRKINRLNDPEQVSRRARLVMPAPQIDDAELYELSKMGALSAEGVAGPGLLTHAPAAKAAGPAATPQLPVRTPLRTPMGRDVVREEAENLLALTQAATPLLGGENAALHRSDFTGITPRRTALRTPMLQTPGRASGVAATPSRTGSVAAVDMIDDGEQSSFQRPLAEKSGKKRKRTESRSLAESLRRLPVPKHEYNVVLPKLGPADEDTEAALARGRRPEGFLEDAEDQLRREQAQIEAQLDRNWMRQSQVVRDMSLPRPVLINSELGEAGPECMRQAAVLLKRGLPHSPANGLLQQAQAWIDRELVLLLEHDHSIHPLDSRDAAADPRQPKRHKTSPAPADNFEHPDWRDVPLEHLQEAQELVDQEFAESGLQAQLQALTQGFAWDQFQELSDQELEFLPHEKRWGLLSSCSPEDQIVALKQRFALLSRQWKQANSRAVKLAKRVTNRIAAPQSLVGELQQQLSAACESLEQAQIRKQVYGALQLQEEAGVVARLQQSRQELQDVRSTESMLQERYQQLRRQLDEVVEKQ